MAKKRKKAKRSKTISQSKLKTRPKAPKIQRISKDLPQKRSQIPKKVKSFVKSKKNGTTKKSSKAKKVSKKSASPKKGKFLSKFNNLRARIWKNHGKRVKNYAETAKIASFVLEKQKTARGINRTQITDKWLRDRVNEYLRLKKPRKKKEPQKPEHPPIPDGLLGTFPYWELDQKMQEIPLDFEPYDIKSDLSLMPVFHVDSYNYNDTFRDYVSFLDMKRKTEQLSGSAPFECEMTFEYDKKAKTYFFEVTELFPTGYERKSDYVPVSSGYKKTIPTEKKRKPKPESAKKKKEKIEEIQAKHMQLDELRKTRDDLKAERDDTIKQIKEYKNLGLTDLENETIKSLTKITEDIRFLNREIGKKIRE